MSTSVFLRAALALALTLAATWGVDALLGHPKLTGIDDANIYFVYARNLVAGHGYVFTPGYERVEGGTSILWSLICALSFFFASSAPDPSTPSDASAALSLLLWISVGLSSGALYLAISLSRSLLRAWGAAQFQSPLPARLGLVLCVVWFAGVPGFYLWNTITLMDAALWTFAVQLLVFFPARDNLAQFSRPADRIGFAFAAGLASLARPESLALVPGVLLVALGCAAPSMGWWSALRRYRAAMLSFALTQLGMLLGRLAYFGDPVPNSYFAKVSGDSLYVLRDGFEYLVSYWVAQPHSAVCLLAVLTCLGVHGGRLLLRRGQDVSPPERASVIISCVIAAGSSLPLVTGGDHFGSYRFFQPYALLMILPLATLLLGPISRSGSRSGSGRKGTALGLAAILLVAGVGGISWARFRSENHLVHEFFLARQGIATGEAIALALPDDALPSIGVVAAGGIAFGYRGRSLDQLGLNWREMAHAPLEYRGLRGHSGFNTRVFWSQPPDLMLPSLLQHEPKDADDIVLEFYQVVLNHLFSKARFRSAYVPGAIQTEKGWLAGFFLRSWLRQSAANETLVGVPWQREPQR